MRTLLIVWCLFLAAPVLAQAPVTVKTALASAEKQLESLRLEMLQTPEGKRYMAAFDVVNQLRAIQPPPQVSKVDPERK